MKRFWKDVTSHLSYAIYSAKSELKSEVANSYLNWIWWVLEPFCFMLIYSFIFGTVLAFLAWKFNFVHNFWAPMISVMKATPVASFIILALLWVGSAHISTLCSFVMGMPIIYSNMYHGLFSVDKKLLEVGQMFQMSRKRQITDIYIPSLKPHLQAAIMVGIGFCWKSGVAAEVIGLANNTIGVHLYNAKVYLETPELFAWTVTIIILSVSIEKLLVSVLNRM